MSRSFVLSVCATLALLTASPAAFAASAGDGRGPVQAAPEPQLQPMDVSTGKLPQVGDEWEYFVQDRLFGKQKQLVWRVKSVDAHGVFEELAISGGSPVEWMFSGKPELIATPTDTGFVFGPNWDPRTPLPKLGVSGTGDCVRRQCLLDARVVGTERITVRAGTFDTVVIKGKVSLNFAAVPDSMDITVWYSEKDRRLIRQVTSMRSTRLAIHLDESVELQAARSLQGGAPAARDAAAASTAPAARKLGPLTIDMGKKPQNGDEWEYIAREALWGRERRLLWRVNMAFSDSDILEDMLVDGKLVRQWNFRGTPQLVSAPTEAGFVFAPHWNGQPFSRLLVSGTGDCVSRLRCEFTFRMAGRERVSVPAGTFDAIRLDGSIGITFSGPQYPNAGRISVWYSERDRRLLKQTVTIRQSGAGVNLDETLELQSARSYQ